MSGPYEDMLHLPHHTSSDRPRMSMSDRAAQFSPFAALTGYDAAIQETGRLTDAKIELTDDELNILNRKALLLEESVRTGLQVEITYFLPDGRKKGGSYDTVRGTIKKIDTIERMIRMTDGTVIPINAVIDITIPE